MPPDLAGESKNTLRTWYGNTAIQMLRDGRLTPVQRGMEGPKNRLTAHPGPLPVQGRGRTPRFLARSHRLDHATEFLGDNVTNAIGGTAGARVIAIIEKIVGVIESEFFAGRNRPGRDDPQTVASEFDNAIGRAVMIDEAREVRFVVAIEIMLFVEVEDEVVAFTAAADRFGFGNSLARIFDDRFAPRKSAPGKETDAMDGRGAGANVSHLNLAELPVIPSN